MIGAAETGSGKTLAFGIPLIQRVMRLKSTNCLKGLVMCPTRELALQVSGGACGVSNEAIKTPPIVLIASFAFLAVFQGLYVSLKF